MKNILIILCILSIILSCKPTKSIIDENDNVSLKDTLIIKDTIIAVIDSDDDELKRKYIETINNIRLGSESSIPHEQIDSLFPKTEDILNRAKELYEFVETQ